ncbi:MAG: energy-coupling factor transporter transmembrane protein EcfT [Olsenella sp.]|jgi:cobalt/nickel transport system permease protein|nr:energy-coupling factor transporter transmembrane protein EcfT [Olsenella sp.]MCI1288216.1 energy-coupling factor transporter transmembrane protein EcfT [Olsenella sp.]
MTSPRDAQIPAWLTQGESYDPPRDHDGFLTKSLLSLAGVLARMRLDDGQSTPVSPSTPLKLVLGLGLILLTSLSGNFAFVLVVLCLALARAALLPLRALRRSMAVACAAAGLTFLLMVPALLLGQAHSPLLLGTKVLTTCLVAMEVALSTPAARLTRALRTLRVPATAILTLDLALRSIVELGRTASEVLVALRLRSVGRDRDKRSSIGGVGGVLLLKAGRSAADTADAMACRCFDGTYQAAPDATRPHARAVDAAWLAGGLVLLVLFFYLQGLV